MNINFFSRIILLLISTLSVCQDKVFYPSAVIPVRGLNTIKDAQGTFYDLFTLGNISGVQILVSFPENITQEEKAKFERLFTQYTNQMPYTFLGDSPYWRPSAPNSPLERLSLHPGSISSPASAKNYGVLFIPGRIRDLEFDVNRALHEIILIRKALLTGQPILALCAGSWRLWEVYATLLTNPNFNDFGYNAESRTYDIAQLQNALVSNSARYLTDVKDHSSSRMICLSTTNAKTNYNIQIHSVKIQPSTRLAQATKIITQYNGNIIPELDVNSVHWKAIKAEVIEPAYSSILKRHIELFYTDTTRPVSNKLIKICAISSHNKQAIQTKNRAGVVMNPEINTIEAYEVQHGSPLFGIQWHPEGYNANDNQASFHRNIIRYMVQAGKAYCNKRKVITALKEKFGENELN
jgi:gamma-glutamyl-gamma-aminobutyrate hydrolase PuuD